MKPTRLLLAAFAACTALATSALLHAAESPAEIVEQAREFLGGDKVLNKVTSLRFTGTAETKLSGADAPADAPTVKSEIEFTFQKPLEFLLTRKDPKGKETVGLTGYDAWKLIETPDQPTRLIMQSPTQIRHLQASAFDSLNFFSGVEGRRGTVTVKGDTTIDGVPAVRVSFVHPGEVEFIRVFDKKTGRLLLTEMSDGQVLREEGEQVVDGIRFPQRVVSVSKVAQPGKELILTTVITINRIQVNAKFASEIFEMPRPSNL